MELGRDDAVSEMIRLRWLSKGTRVVDFDIVFALAEWEAEVVKMRPELRGWRRTVTKFMPVELIVWTPPALGDFVQKANEATEAKAARDQAAWEALLDEKIPDVGKGKKTPRKRKPKG